MTKNMTKIVKKTLHLVIFMVGGGIFGFVVASGWLQEGAANLRFDPSIYYKYDVPFGFAALIFLILSGLTIAGLYRMRNIPAPLGELSEDWVNKEEYALSKLLIISTYNSIVTMIWMLTAIAYAASSAAAPSEGGFIIGVILAGTGAVLATTFLQFRSVQLYNKHFPSRSLDYFGKDGQKEFFDKLDEAEKYTVYRSAFSAYKAVNAVLLICMFGFVLYSVFFTFSPLPIIVLGIIWMVQQAAYYLEASKVYRSK
ncbi:DUF3169 family protein [Paenibacillus sp. 1P07SE]|uniref:DUF3169 family protein n=1 Tax=Paenibacillus sp. 1P07SE TaxID=3132209 RepID=UPI0039A5A379